MDCRLIFLALLALVSSSLAQVRDVKKDAATNNLLESFDVGTGLTITFESGSTLTFNGTLADGVKITFNPAGTNAGLNVGSYAGVPSSLANGDLWYDSTANALKARINGSTVSLGAGGGSGDVVGPASATDNAVVRFDLTTGKLVQDSVVTIADTTGNIAGVGTINGNTIPAGTNTFAMLGTNNTWTGTNTFGVTTFQPGFNMINAGLGVLTLESHSTQTTNHTISLKSNAADSVLSFNGNVTFASSFTTSGANALTLTTTGATNVTLPTSGTLATVAGTEPALGNPPADGYVLSSTTGGTRSWIAVAGTGTVTSFSATDGNGFDFSVANSTTTPTLTATPDTTHGFIKRGYANGTAVLAGTPDFDGQFLTSTDGYVGFGYGTSAGNVQGIMVVGAGDGNIYTVNNWNFDGDMTMSTSRTAQLRSLTVSSGNLTVSAGKIAATTTGSAGEHTIKATGATFIDNVIDLQNTTDNGAGSLGYSAIAYWHPSDTIDNGRQFATGVGPNTAGENANKAYLSTSPPSGSPTNSPMDISFTAEQSLGGNYLARRRIYCDNTNYKVTIYGKDNASASGPTGVEVDASGNVTLAPTSAGTVTIGGGATASKLQLMEPSGSGTNKTTFKAGAQSADIDYTLPTTAPGEGTILRSTAGGVQSWGALPGYISGFTLSNNGTDAANDIDIAAGYCADSTGAVMMTGTAMTKQLDATWAAGTNAGGRFSGVSDSTSTWYHIYAILKDSDGSVDYGFNDDLTPTMPAGYTYYRYLGSIYNDSGGAIRTFTMFGEGREARIVWAAPVLEVDVTNLGTSTDYTLSQSIPPSMAVEATVVAGFSDATAGVMLYVRRPGDTDSAPSNTTAPLGQIRCVSAGGNNYGSFSVTTNTSQQISARSSDTSSTLKLEVVSFRFSR